MLLLFLNSNSAEFCKTAASSVRLDRTSEFLSSDSFASVDLLFDLHPNPVACPVISNQTFTILEETVWNLKNTNSVSPPYSGLGIIHLKKNNFQITV